MSVRRVIEGLLILAIAVMTVEVMVRRWLYDQLPTQLDARWVYGILTVNLLVIAYATRTVLARHRRQHGRS